MPSRPALGVVLLLTLLPSGSRHFAPRPRDRTSCVPEGRGKPPRHWVGCAGDGGMRRGLTAGERLLHGQPLDPNQATAAELAGLPGISSGLAAAIVADREARGPFASVDEVGRVRGIGRVRLAAVRPHLAVEPAPGPPAAPGR